MGSAEYNCTAVLHHGTFCKKTVQILKSTAVLFKKRKRKTSKCNFPDRKRRERKEIGGQRVSPETFGAFWFHFSPANVEIGKEDGRRRAHP